MKGSGKDVSISGGNERLPVVQLGKLALCLCFVSFGAGGGIMAVSIKVSVFPHKIPLFPDSFEKGSCPAFGVGLFIVWKLGGVAALHRPSLEGPSATEKIEPSDVVLFFNKLMITRGIMRGVRWINVVKIGLDAFDHKIQEALICVQFIGLFLELLKNDPAPFRPGLRRASV